MDFINKIKRKIMSICVGLLSSDRRVEKESGLGLEKERSNVTSPDFVDYDGMGNQGRFPSKREK